MKRRDTLLRLKRFKVEDLQRRLSTLDTMRADLERKVADLEESVARELAICRILQLRYYYILMISVQLPGQVPVASDTPDQEGNEKAGPTVPDVFRFAR